MYYINTETMRYPMRTAAIRAENSNTSFSENFIPPDIYQPVYPTITPPFDEWTQDVREIIPILIDGKWTQVWEVIPKFHQYQDESGTVHTIQEQEAVYRQNRLDMLAISIRDRRNDLLSKSDWTQVADVPVDKQAWAIYRSELRDITLQESFPLSVIWPTAPA